MRQNETLTAMIHVSFNKNRCAPDASENYVRQCAERRSRNHHRRAKGNDIFDIGVNAAYIMCAIFYTWFISYPGIKRFLRKAKEDYG
jgi:hypothetical protein